MRALADHGASALGRTVASVMSKTVVTCRCGDSVDELMASMTERRHRHLPVVDDEQVLLGIISIGDVVKARLGAAAEREPGAHRVHPPGPLTPRSLGSPRVGRRSLGANYRKLFAATTISNLGDGVSLIAYPWLATAVTRNPLLIALVAVVQRLPWLLFTLPAGVITDRHDRRRLMVGANAIRFVLTARGGAGRAGALAARCRRRTRSTRSSAPSGSSTWCCSSPRCCSGRARCSTTTAPRRSCRPSSTTPTSSRPTGRCTRPRSSPTSSPGRRSPACCWPPGSCCRSSSTPGRSPSPPGSCSASWPPGGPSRRPAAGRAPAAFKQELAEGFRWLWHHPLLRTFAITLGFLNMLGQVYFATIVLYGQEVLHTSAFEFGLMTTVSAVGGVLGGWLGSRDHQAHRLRRLGAADAVVRRRLRAARRVRVAVAARRRCCSG